MSDEQIHEAIRELKDQLRADSYAIRAMERIASGRPHRGRLPKFLAELADLGQEGRHDRRTW